MALSNWDTLAIGPDGQVCDGTVKFHETTIEIYKNWVYVSTDKIATDNEHKVIATINSGNINLLDATIIAIRGPQQAVFVYASCAPKYQKVEGEYQIVEPAIHFCGIGCYGFDDLTEEYIRGKGYVLPAPFDKLMWFSSSDFANGESKDVIGFYYQGKETRYQLDPGVDLNPYVGVKESTFNEFKKWLYELSEDGEADKEYVDSINWNSIKRFNQGDKYFADNVGAPLQDTHPGEVEQPHIIKAFQDIPKQDDEPPKS